MGMTIGEIEVGKDYRLGQTRIHVLGIEKLEEKSYYGSRPRNVRHVKYVPVDKETGEKDGRPERYTLARNISQPWDEYVQQTSRYRERNAPRVAGEKKVQEAIQSLFLFEGQPEVRVSSHLQRRYYSDSGDVDFDAKRYMVEIKLPDVFVERFVTVLELANQWAEEDRLPVPERLSEKAMRESDGEE